MMFQTLLGVSSFSHFKCLALTAKAVGFFEVWIGTPAVAAVRPMQRLRVSANAYFIADHVTLAPSLCARG
jgi:hypothetical protein